MDLLEKLSILSAAAKYDVSCSSSGSQRGKKAGQIGSTASSGICHSWSEDGRCISLLKILMSNVCSYDCLYCVNRTSNDVPRAFFTPDEICELTVNFYNRNYIEGLFLSSAIQRSPDYTMDLLLATVRKLRTEHRYNGYIHLKAIPGANERLIKEAGILVDRMSVNIELPSESGLKMLAPQKKKEAIIQPMSKISQQITANREERLLFKKSPAFVPAGQSTQLIIGATADSDRDIIRLSENLYRRFQLKRVYFSAYMPVSDNPKLPVLALPPLTREHRLYQADWLLRFYGFSADELLDESEPNFDLELDPKTTWALRNPQHFPVEINRADLAMLLRVPGIGVKSAKRILVARRVRQLEWEHLGGIGVVLKRARFFITCRGKYDQGVRLDGQQIRLQLLNSQLGKRKRDEGWKQLSLFGEPTNISGSGIELQNKLIGNSMMLPSHVTRISPLATDVFTHITGEL